MYDVVLYNSRQHRQLTLETGTLVLARAGGERPLWIPIAPQHAEQAPAAVRLSSDEGRLTLAMTGCEGECFCGRKCGLTGDCRLELPARFSIGDTQFEIVESSRAHAPMRPLQKLHEVVDASRSARKRSLHGKGPAPATLADWFETVAALHHWATSLQELYVTAARGAVESIGLDGAIVFRRRDGEWEVAASFLPRPELGIHFDERLLDQLLDSPETMFQGGEGRKSRVATQEPESGQVLGFASNPDLSVTSSPPAVVVSPLRNSLGELVGAVYGYRTVRAGNGRRGIRYLEAHFIELLAHAVSEGIARLEHEAEVDQHRALLQHPFARGESMERSRISSEQREVTLLFADLRGFTQLANALSPAEVYELLGQVMDCLTGAVMDHDGLVIDYLGDGLAAMWNSPADQAEHPELACRAAVRMQRELPELAADWKELLPEAAYLRLGIGIHTGTVQVGNSGSRRRVKYGPRGANVHLAARVEAATKCLHQTILASADTAECLSSRFTTARVCRAGLAGIAEPVDLYAVWPRDEAESGEALSGYSRALAYFENGELESAAQVLDQLDPTTTRLPVEFLAKHVERLLSAQGRRSGDGSPALFRGVVAMSGK